MRFFVGWVFRLVVWCFIVNILGCLGGVIFLSCSVLVFCVGLGGVCSVWCWLCGWLFGSVTGCLFWCGGLYWFCGLWLLVFMLGWFGLIYYVGFGFVDVVLLL